MATAGGLALTRRCSTALARLAPLPLLLLATLIGCDGKPREPVRAERAILVRQVQELEKIAGRSRSGPLVPFGQTLLAVDASLVQDLLTVALPYETVVGDQFRIRVLEAFVTFEDGLPFVHLRGRASFADQPETAGFVEADVYGSLREFDLKGDDPALRGRIDVIAFETRVAKVQGEENQALQGLIGDLASLNLEVFKNFDYSFEIPVKLVREIVLPEVGGASGFRIAEARIPLQIAVTNVTALRGKLWISIDLYDQLKPAESPRPTIASREGGPR